MHDYSRSLGVAVKKSRKQMGLTQVKLAELIGVESRTIINIEGCEGNPLLENLYPLIRTLKIDPWDVFYPELKQRDAAKKKLKNYCQYVRQHSLRLRQKKQFKYKIQSLHPHHLGKQALRFMRLALCSASF